MSFGSRLAERRTEKNLSQAQLAELVGVSAQTVYRWEYDVRSPDVHQLKKLCAALSVPPEYFLCEEGEKAEKVPPMPGISADPVHEKEGAEGERLSAASRESTEKLLRSCRRMLAAGVVLIAVAVAVFGGGMALLLSAMDVLSGMQGESADSASPGGGTGSESSDPVFPGAGEAGASAGMPDWPAYVLFALALIGLAVGLFLLVRYGKKLKLLRAAGE